MTQHTGQLAANIASGKSVHRASGNCPLNQCSVVQRASNCTTLTNLSFGSQIEILLCRQPLLERQVRLRWTRIGTKEDGNSPP
jgi:hypothetical protein